MLAALPREDADVKIWISLLLAACLPALALAEEDKKEAAPQVAYVALVPPLVGNYTVGSRLKLYKADISLRVSGADAQTKVQLHEPLIRNQLVMLFAQQTEETLTGLDGKEKLRQEALKQVQQILNDEEGAPLVDDLLFNNLIIQ